MNLVNFHTYEKNRKFIHEIPVILEFQGNFERYDIAVVGDYYNLYKFLVKDIITNEIFNIDIKEERIRHWNIKNGYQTYKKHLNDYTTDTICDSLYFDAIGFIHELNKYVNLFVTLNSQQFNLISVCNKLHPELEKRKLQVLDITIKNDSFDLSHFKQPTYNLSNNPIFTRCFNNEFRFNRFLDSEENLNLFRRLIGIEYDETISYSHDEYHDNINLEH